MSERFLYLKANNLQTISDAAYAYSGYAPLIVRILEEGDRVRWAGWHKTFDNSVGGELKSANSPTVRNQPPEVRSLCYCLVQRFSTDIIANTCTAMGRRFCVFSHASVWSLRLCAMLFRALSNAAISAQTFKVYPI